MLNATIGQRFHFRHARVADTRVAQDHDSNAVQTLDVRQPFVADPSVLQVQVFRRVSRLRWASPLSLISVLPKYNDSIAVNPLRCASPLSLIRVLYRPKRFNAVRGPDAQPGVADLGVSDVQLLQRSKLLDVH